MRYIRIIFLLCFILPTLIFSQGFSEEINCNECLDISIYYRNNIDSLSISDISNFLLCFDNQCSNNVELAEFKNGFIFILLKEKTDLTLSAFEKFKIQLPWDNICKEISQPVFEWIDVKETLRKVEDVSEYDKVKKDVIKALEEAVEKSN